MLPPIKKAVAAVVKPLYFSLRYHYHFEPAQKLIFFDIE